MTPPFPRLLHTVLDTTDVRELAEFYRQLLGLRYRAGDEPPGDGPDGQAGWCSWTPTARGSWPSSRSSRSPPATWPAGEVPQQLHLDFTVPDREALAHHHARALALGARELRDGSAEEVEPIHVYADPAGHPFCVFVG